MGNSFKARYAGSCALCGTEIQKGADIMKYRRTYIHCSCEPSDDAAADREYYRGRADGERYSIDRKMYGDELAERFALEDEMTSFWKHGEGW
jgi:hypothetical protein